MDQSFMSQVVAGCMKWGLWGAKFSTPQYLAMIEDCLSWGVTSFDHADIYGHYTTEEEFGKALSIRPSLRGQIQLVTKCGIRIVTPNRPAHLIKSYDTSRMHIIESAERSLRNFSTDYLDAFLIHRPDPLMEADEIAAAFSQLKQQGKVLHVGVSNFGVTQTNLLHSRIGVEINQVEISITSLEPFTDGVLDQCQQFNILPMAWSPMGGGNLFRDAGDERHLRIMAVASLLADKYSASPDQILLSWLLLHPAGILPVMGTSRPERIKAAMDATQIAITREEWFMLWRASTGREVD